jgi:hypothetical protein
VKKLSIFVMFSAAMLTSCSGADVDVKAILAANKAQLEQCYTTNDAKVCDAAIAMFDKDIPLLKNACSSGNNDACGLFPGYDYAPEMLRSYKKICVDNYVDPSMPDNLKQVARQGMKAGCDKMKFTGPTL